MTDTAGDGTIDQEAETLIQELLDAGFAYDHNDRLQGFAHQGDTDASDDDGADDADGDDSQSGGAGAGGTADVGADGGDVDAGDDGGAADDAAGDGQGGAGDASTGAHSGRLELNGTPLTAREAETLLGIRKLLLDHPELGPKFNEMATEVVTGRKLAPVEQQTAPEKPALPDYIDPDDEQSVRLWSEIQELKAQREQDNTRMEQATVEASQARVQSEVAQAIDRFKVDHPDLTDAEIETIRNYSSANVNIPGVMGNYPSDPVTGLVKVLEIGSLSAPEVRDKVLGITKNDRAATDRRRQSDLSKLSGGGGSTGNRGRAPREKKPASWNEVADRLAKELESLGGTS